MIVNKNVIAAHNPCKSRFDNYLEYYSDFNGSMDEFLDLPNITYNDKMWVAKRILNRNQLIHFAVLCANSVLYIYQNKYPNDNRIKDCIDYMMTVTDFSSLNNQQQSKLRELRSAAYDAADAAYAAYAAAAYAAAYAAAAADAAAYADAVAYADAAAAYAAADAAAYAAADAAADAAARKEQQDLNLQFLKIVADL